VTAARSRSELYDEGRDVPTAAAVKTEGNAALVDTAQERLAIQAARLRMQLDDL
jgi:hypothetical protein